MQVPSVPVPPPPLMKLPQFNNNQQTFVQKSTFINIYIHKFREISTDKFSSTKKNKIYK